MRISLYIILTLGLALVIGHAALSQPTNQIAAELQPILYSKRPVDPTTFNNRKDQVTAAVDRLLKEKKPMSKNELLDWIEIVNTNGCGRELHNVTLGENTNIMEKINEKIKNNECQ